MKRLTQLDGIRGIAILLVLIWHYWCCQLSTPPGTLLSYSRRALDLTWSGVDLFFVLSGFLIAGILLDNQGATNYFRVFYLRRACRILPLYYLHLAGFIVVSALLTPGSETYRWLLAEPYPMGTYATFTQNIFMGMCGDFGPHWLGITWSLAVEEQFYLVVPLLIWLLPKHQAFLAMFALVLAAPALRWASPGFHAYVGTPWRADSLMSGACLAMLVRWPPFMTAIARHRAAVVGLLMVLLLGAGALTARPSCLGPFGHLWLAALYSLFVLLAYRETGQPLAVALSFAPLVWLGQRSYGIYMFHQGAAGLLHGAIRSAPPQIQGVADAGVTCLSLAITLLLAETTFRVYESPFLAFGQRTQYRRPIPVPMGVAPIQRSHEKVLNPDAMADMYRHESTRPVKDGIDPLGNA